MAQYFRGLYTKLIGGMCDGNCSGHGDCHNGTCFCDIKFSGSECGGLNMNYHLGLASLYLFVALVTFVQLLTAVAMAWKNGDKCSGIGRRFRDAFKTTTPKAVYAIIFAATFLRSICFAVAATITLSADESLSSLLSVYYPLLLTVFSLIICLWAELFHLDNISFESNRFLSKSFLGFVAFNIITYSLLLAQLLLVLANTDVNERMYYLNVFNGCYAVLFLIVVTFFLIYGVEVFFKVRGGFIILSGQNRAMKSETDDEKLVNTSQLNQSRLGLVSQAAMLIVTVLFILSDVSGDFWKSKVPVESRNYHDIIFRLVEVGVALWFPCVLWNVNRPEQLWILNPKKILRKGDGFTERIYQETDEVSLRSNESVGCYMCYDPERTDAGALIRPCECRGDVATVHHECLRKWLMERASQSGTASCSICKTPYNLETDKPLSWRACSDVSAAHWLKFSLMITAISGMFLATWALCHILPSTPYKVLVVGLSIVGTYVIMKFLGQNTFSAYKQAKVSSLQIKSREADGGSGTGPAVVENKI